MSPLKAATRLLQRAECWGLLLRVVLMPVGACWDLYSNYWISHQWVYHGTIPLQQYGGYLFLWPIFHLHSAWLWLIRPLLGSGDIWGEGLTPLLSLTDMWQHAPDLEAFYLHPHIHWILFLLKCPFVLTECLLIYLMLRAETVPAQSRETLRWFLWLNPFSLYSIALFGGWDIMPTTLVVASALLVRRHTIWAGLCLSVAAIMKVFPVLLWPFFLLLGAQSSRERLSLVVGTTIPIVLYFGVGGWLGLPLLNTAFGIPHYAFVISSELPLHFSHDRLYPFLVGYVMLVFHAAEHRRSPSWTTLVRYCAASLLLFYSVSFFHPQYILWVVPFLAIVVALHPRWWWMVGLQALCLGLYTLQWGGILTTYLVAPLNPRFFMHCPSPLDWLVKSSVNPDVVFGVVHSIFAGVSLWMMALMLRRRPERA